MEKLKNKLWIFGHPTNSLKGVLGVRGDSDLEAVASMEVFGAQNIFYVPMGRPTDRDQKSYEMRNARKVGWNIDNITEVRELIPLKAKYQNIEIGLFDDFFSENNPDSNYTNYSIKQMLALREELHEAGLEMWAVFYSMQTEPGAWIDYLKIFDGVTFWFWSEPTVAEFEEKCEFFFEHTKGQKRMIGCYMFNLGEEKEATPESVRYQLNRDLDFIKEGKLDGIILHTNAFGGLGYKAFDEGVAWCREHGEDLV